MSGVKRTVDCHTLKTRDIVVQNSNNTFPDAGGVLCATNETGQITVNRDINLTQLLINDKSTIDASGNIFANEIILAADACGNAIETFGDIYVNNANIYAGDDTNITGFVSTSSLRVADLSDNTVTTLYALHDNLLWQGPSSPLNISQGIRNLRVPATYKNFRLLRNPDMSSFNPQLDPIIVPTLNRILRLFNSRKIFIALA